MHLAGTFVIPWSEAEVDGLMNACPSQLSVGSSFVWTGQAVRIDGPSSVLSLGMPVNRDHLREGAARKARQLLGAGGIEVQDKGPQTETVDQGFILTNGIERLVARLVRSATSGQLLLGFYDGSPQAGCEYWVTQSFIDEKSVDRLMGRAPSAQAGVICFCAGTGIDTPHGVRRVEDLRAGDYVMTRDSGPQEVLWTGSRRMSGARLFAMPHLRPVRIHASAFGADRPDETLLVSPEHRLLVRGDAARALFNTPEVLVQASDLVNDHSIVRATDLREVTYIHVLLSQHEILWANGIECESFHPATASMDALDPDDRISLEALLPYAGQAPMQYGDFARRTLNQSEAAILSYDT